MMMTQTNSPTAPTLPSAGFGLGLRTAHYADFLAGKQPVDWLEIISDNYFLAGGKPLHVLDTLRRDYPMAMHGVAMSIGASAGLDMAYLQQVKALAQRIEPLWVSDHLCWIGTQEQHLHDLFPLPYTDESARHVVAQIRAAQDFLGRRLVIENVSSYIDYRQSACSEWQFLNYVAQEADCLLLVDVNNIYVSSVNHGFNAMDYLQGLPAQRVQQIHLAGHQDNGDHIIDTHDRPVSQAVWDVYAQAYVLFPNVSAMIERDAQIPALQVLLAELNTARSIAAQSTLATQYQAPTWVASPDQAVQTLLEKSAVSLALSATQTALAAYVLGTSESAQELVKPAALAPPERGLCIYRNAYQARLAEVLADTFSKTYLFMGSGTFDADAGAYAVAHPPTTRSLNRYGATFPTYLHQRYPNNPELLELALLEWQLRCCFDGDDVPALDAAAAQSDPDATWLARPHSLHPSVSLRPVSTNAVQLWRAIADDQDVPEARAHASPAMLMVWRLGFQPYFRTLDKAEADFIGQLHQGHSIQTVCAQLEQAGQLPSQATLGQWMGDWFREGLLRAEFEQVIPFLLH